jgi:hypothetical protein
LRKFLSTEEVRRRGEERIRRKMRKCAKEVHRGEEERRGSVQRIYIEKDNTQ